MENAQTENGNVLSENGNVLSDLLEYASAVALGQHSARRSRETAEAELRRANPSLWNLVSSIEAGNWEAAETQLRILLDQPVPPFHAPTRKGAVIISYFEDPEP